VQRVLVVDDDLLVADTLALIFRKNGYESKATYSAEAAMKYAREFTPDLLLCDITMPGRDGLALVGDMTREVPSCSILVLTGFHSNLKTIRDQAQRLRRDVGILTKPCQPADLLRKAGHMLANA
jgi:DNA-binding response OmpR family regulator